MSGMDLGRRPWVGTVLIGAVAIALGALTLGAPGGAIAFVAALLFAAVRHDNDLGTCFPLVLLLLIMVAVLTLLIVMLSILDSR